MKRSELVTALAERFPQMTHHDAEATVRVILQGIAEAMARGHRVEVRGFGSFTVSHHAPRSGRNPRTGEQVDVPGKRVPHFKPGKTMRDAVNGEDVAAAGQNSGSDKD